jgi:asparagine synthase (glutamine-hydrolysing)
LLDHRLVELAATIPSSLKIRGGSDAKYIERQMMRGILPEPIVNRKDKLGHSIPLKNWLRTNRSVQTFVQDVLASQALRDVGVNRPCVQRLWEEHQSYRRNNSHRLWTLTVLGLWLATQ